jgi:hypothetical protein
MSMDANTQDLFDELKDILDNYAEVIDGPDGQPRPNRAMVALGVLDTIRHRYEATLQAAHATEAAYDKALDKALGRL